MRFDRLLAGTALALVLAVGTAQAQIVQASAPDTASLDAAVPVTAPAALVVTPADIAPAAETKAETAPAPSETPAVTDSKPEVSAEPATAAAPAGPAETAVAPATETAVAPPAETAIAPPAETAVTQPPATEPPPTPPADIAAVPPTAPADIAVTPADIAVTPPAAAPPAATPPAGTAAAPASGEPAATGSIPVAPLDKVFTVDQQVGEKLGELLARKADRRFDAKARTSLESFYAARSLAPLWTDNGAVNARARAVMAQLRGADADGLDPDDYPVPQLAADAGPEEVAEFELKLNASVLAYARHAAVGRVHWSRIARDIVYTLTPPEPGEVLGRLASAADPRQALDSYNPQHPHYKALKAKLAEIRGQKGEAAPARVAYGPLLRPGMEDDRVPVLRERLGLTGDGTTYDAALVDAIKAFQKKRGLRPDGLIGSGTVDAFNGPRNDRAADIITANLERWRWVTRDLGESHVIVNIPEYTLRVYDDGALKWTTRVVVGKPSTPTPLLSETMKFITVNPTWNVPPSIVYNEYLPALQQDPTVLERMGLRVSRRSDGSVHISQPPGAANALGRIRFNFPNKFLVYQHDTPDKNLFAHDKRAYSHGCMRVKDPDKYAEVLLSIALPKEGYSADRIRRMYGSGETNINFPTPIPVHLTYQTAYVDEAGKLVLRDDIYGRDARVIAALKSDERKFADVPVEQRRDASPARRQTVRLPQEQPRASIFPLFNLFR